MPLPLGHAHSVIIKLSCGIEAHEDEHVSVARLTAETAVDNLKDAGGLAAHVCELRYEVEVSQSRYRQHRPSSFAMKRFRPS